jgi:hypothetical protein
MTSNIETMHTFGISMEPKIKNKKLKVIKHGETSDQYTYFVSSASKNDYNVCLRMI